MSQHTDSQIVEHHEDGSWTTTTIVTEYPATTAEKAAAWGTLGALTVLSVAPLFVPLVYDKIVERRERKAKAKLELVKNEN